MLMIVNNWVSGCSMIDYICQTDKGLTGFSKGMDHLTHCSVKVKCTSWKCKQMLIPNQTRCENILSIVENIWLGLGNLGVTTLDWSPLFMLFGFRFLKFRCEHLIQTAVRDVVLKRQKYDQIIVSCVGLWGQTSVAEVELVPLKSRSPVFFGFIASFIVFDQRRSRISRAMRVCHVRSLKTRRHLNHSSLRPGPAPALEGQKNRLLRVSPCYRRGRGSSALLPISISTWIWGICESVNIVSSRSGNNVATVRQMWTMQRCVKEFMSASTQKASFCHAAGPALFLELPSDCRSTTKSLW